MSKCPHLEYKDTYVFFGYEERCKAQFGKVLYNNNSSSEVKKMVDDHCKTSKYYDCPFYKAMK